MATDDSTHPGGAPDDDDRSTGRDESNQHDHRQAPVLRDRLTDDDSGQWRVTTQASTYLIDLDLGRAMRLPGHRSPAAGTKPVTVMGADGLPYEVTQLEGDGQWERLLFLIHCVVGEPMYLYTNPEPHVLTPRGSTPVHQIRQISLPTTKPGEPHDDEQ